MLNKFFNPAAIKDKEEHLQKTLKEGTQNLNQKIDEGIQAIDRQFHQPQKYNYLIFALPMLLVLAAFIPLPVWILQVFRLTIFACMGYVLFYEYRSSHQYDQVFFIALALMILFNPVIPFYVPGILINLISIIAIGYLAILTQIEKSKRALPDKIILQRMKSQNSGSSRDNSHQASKAEKTHSAKAT
jgi:predicted membrane protein